MNFFNNDLGNNPGGLQRRSERESLLDHPTSDVYFQQVQIPMNKKMKAKNEDDDEDRRIRAAQREKDPYLETQIQSGDTLHSLALKFNVPLSELKRLNNIFSENEFFALKKIKIPVKPMSFLTEKLNDSVVQNENPDSSDWKIEHFSSPLASSEISSPPAASDESGDNLTSDLRYEHSIGKNANRQVRKARKLLRAVDKDINVIKQKNQVIKSTVIPSNLQQGWEDSQFESEDDDDGLLIEKSESVLLLPSNHSINITRPPEGSKILCVCCIALVVIAVIVILIFSEYEYEVIEHKNRTSTGNLHKN